MSALPYLNAVGEVAKVGMVLTLIMNSFLIYITMYHIRNIKGPYKFLIILLAVLGMIFSVMEIFVHAFMHSFNASFAYFSIDPIFGASKMIRTALILIYSEIYLMIICVIALQFVNRYFVITGSNLVNTFEGWRVISWMFYVSCCCAVWAGSAYVCLADKCSIEYLREEMMSQYNQSSDDISGFLIVAYEQVGGVKTLRMNSVMCVSGYSIVLMIQYIIILYCGFYIHIKIKNNLAATSSKKLRVQSQLFKTLVLQISAPSLFYHAPAFVMFIVPFFDWKLSVPSGVMICFFSIYPAIDTYILMWMVTEYHQVIGKMTENTLTSALEWVKRMTMRMTEENTGTTTTP